MQVAGILAACLGARWSPPAFRRRIALAVLLLWAACGVALADASIAAPDGSRTRDHVRIAAHRAADTLLITLRIDPGYHINANPASNDYLIPTSVAFPGITPERITYPPTIPFTPAFADGPIDVYEGAVVVVANFASTTLERMHELGFTVTAQACTKEICLPPDDISGHATW